MLEHILNNETFYCPLETLIEFGYAARIPLYGIKEPMISFSFTFTSFLDTNNIKYIIGNNTIIFTNEKHSKKWDGHSLELRFTEV